MTTAVMLGGPHHGALVLMQLHENIRFVSPEPAQPGKPARRLVEHMYTLRRITFGGYMYWVYLSPELLGTILTAEHFALIVDKHPTRVGVHNNET